MYIGRQALGGCWREVSRYYSFQHGNVESWEFPLEKGLPSPLSKRMTRPDLLIFLVEESTECIFSHGLSLWKQKNRVS